MVAYNFKKQFAPAVKSGCKLQTIRAMRKRHAMPGEAIQLYTGMRTKSCQKLISPDPTCKAIRPIKITVDSVWVDGVILLRHEVERLAIADGFDGIPDFMRFFKETHGLPFEGVLIEWQ